MPLRAVTDGWNAVSIYPPSVLVYLRGRFPRRLTTAHLSETCHFGMLRCNIGDGTLNLCPPAMHSLCNTASRSHKEYRVAIDCAVAICLLFGGTQACGC